MTMPEENPKLTPYRVDVSEEILADLDRRLAATRWPGEPDDAKWQYGANLGYMKRLVDYWRDGFDWRGAEAGLNRFPQFTAAVATDDGETLDVHFVYERGSGTRPLPVLITHGWPGSVFEFNRIIEPLAHPERFGGDAEDGFDVIAPTLPGYGFSQAPARPIGPRAIAGMLHRLMNDVLAYPSYVAQGGDWGSIITAWLALDHGDHVTAAHFNMTPVAPSRGPDDPPLSETEQAWLADSRARLKRESAYQDVQATKSQSLAYGLTDSPVALAAWITEKFHGWSDESREEPPFTMDQILTNVMIYWITGCMNSATWLYRAAREEGTMRLPSGQRIDVPCGFLLAPHDLLIPPPDSWLERIANVARRRDLASGGHFVALEKGAELVDDMRAFFRATAR